MHELSIAMSIVEICTEEAEKAGAGRVTRVEVEIGSLAGVEPEALSFSWDIATQSTLLEGAPLEIIHTAAMARCKSCSHEFPVDNFFSPCPECQEFGYEIFKGKELQIKSILVE
jgi:hydrogenase nickel incorporation protein HypA/HybF